MNTHTSLRGNTLCTFVALVLFFGFLPNAPVRAQNASTDKPISLNLHNVPIQTALQLLFTGAGIRNSSIDNDVQGYANINVNEVPLTLALRTLLSSVNPPLASDIVDGVYHVHIQRAVTPPAPVIQTPTVAVDASETGNASTDDQPKRFYRIPIDKYDAYYIARLLGAQGIVQVGINDVVASGTSSGTNGGNTGFGGTNGGRGNNGFGGTGNGSNAFGGTGNGNNGYGGGRGGRGGRGGGFGGFGG